MKSTLLLLAIVTGQPGRSAPLASSSACSLPSAAAT